MTLFDWFLKVESNVSLSSILYIISTLYICIWSLAFFGRQNRLSVLNKIPGPRCIPILGNAIELLGGETAFFEAFNKKFVVFPGGLSRVWIAFTPYCLIYSAKGVETLLNNSKNLDKTVDYKAVEPWLGTGLLTSSGSKWRRRRKLLTPAFHFKILDDFVDVFNQKSRKFVSKLDQKTRGKSFDIYPLLILCTLDIILETAMGRNINVQDNPNLNYVEAVYEMGKLAVERQTRPWLQLSAVFKLMGYAKRQKDCLKVLHSFALETIRDRRKTITKTQKEIIHHSPSGYKNRLAFLDLLLESSEVNESLSDEDIREEVDTFMFEGHDTVGAALNWTIYLLGSHPEIQNKVYEELESIFGGSDREATSSDLREMRYLECCIKESLRMFPSVPVFGRELKEDLVIDGTVIPRGTNAFVIPYQLHRDPSQFPEPNTFKPERFSPENSVKISPFAYVPFSAGPRNCIGQKFALMEEKIVLSTLLRKFRVESDEKMGDLRLTGQIILRPEKGTFVKIFPRQT